MRERADGSRAVYRDHGDYYRLDEFEPRPDDPTALHAPREEGGQWRAGEDQPFTVQRELPEPVSQFTPERDINSGDPRDVWIPDEGDELPEEEIVSRLKTIQNGTVEWTATDEDGACRRKRYPVFVVPKSKWPEIYDEDVKAPNIADGVPNLWRYGQYTEKQRRKIRRAAQGKFALRPGYANRLKLEPKVRGALSKKYGGSPEQYELDAHESVPATFLENKAVIPGVFGHVGLVPRGQNQNHGQALGQFFRIRGVVRKGQWVIYIVVDDTKDPEKWRDF